VQKLCLLVHKICSSGTLPITLPACWRPSLTFLYGRRCVRRVTVTWSYTKNESEDWWQGFLCCRTPCLKSAADRLETIAFDCFIQEQTEEFSVSCCLRREYTVWTLQCAIGLLAGSALQVTVVTVTVTVVYTLCAAYAQSASDSYTFCYNLCGLRMPVDKKISTSAPYVAVRKTDRQTDRPWRTDRHTDEVKSWTYSDNLRHLAWFDCSVSVDVVHLKRPLELLFRFSGGSDVDGQQELLEVDASAVIGVERPEHVLAELLGVALREEAWVDFQKLGPRQLTGRTVLLELTQHCSNINCVV